MNQGRTRFWAVGASGLVAGTSHPAYALGDQVIPVTAALLATPLLLGLFWAVVYVVNRGKKTAPGRPEQVLITAVLALLFDAGWLTWLVLLDPSTWTVAGTDIGWGLLFGYLLPLGGFAGLLLLRERVRPALVLAGVTLAVAILYWLGWQL